jgi:phenylalanyl-tRNA synthetase beta chain
MKFPLSMLLDLVRTDLDAQGVGDLLTMAGFELEGIEEVEGEPVLDVAVMSNRGDGLSVVGLAREVLAKDSASRPTELYQRAVARFPMDDSGVEPSGASVSIETGDCTRYACRLYRGVRNGDSPEWVQKRLRQVGMRPISLLVDLTNYVMLEVGQPLHAFDQDRLEEGSIVVRKARPGERLTTLNGETHELQPDQMMICDARRPVAAAGIMGGEETEVGPSTTRVLLESAHFANSSVRRTRKQLGLSTEASYRFERSVDPELVVSALNRFTELLEEATGESWRVPGVIDRYPAPPVPREIRLGIDRAGQLLGMEIGADEARGYLERLGFSVEDDGKGYRVTAPTWRPDVEREEDLVEELGRVHGYEKIPELLPQGVSTQGGAFGFEGYCDRVREAILRSGFDQIWSHSLSDEHPLDDPQTKRIGPRNPGSPEYRLLRNTLLTSLSDAARRNGGRDVRLFELGRTFGRQDGSMFEEVRLGLLSQGRMLPFHWTAREGEEMGFFALKGVLEHLMEVSGLALELEPSSDPRLHPGRQAGIRLGTVFVGLIGQIHPSRAEAAGLPEDTVVAEVSLPKVYERSREPVRLRAISRNPAVRRDISLVVDKEVPYAKLEGAVASACGEVLERQWLFDVYEGSNLAEGKHSLAIAIQLRKLGENFTDEEANQVREKAAEALEALGATVRR